MFFFYHITFNFNVHFRISFKHSPSNIPDKISCSFWILLVSRDAWCHKMPRCLKLPLHCTPQLKNIYITLGTQGLFYLQNNNSKDMSSWTYSQAPPSLATMKNIDVSSIATQATLQAIPAALAKAHQVYGVKDSKVVFVMNEDGRNFADWCQVRRWVLGGCFFFLFFFFFRKGRLRVIFFFK